MKDVIVMLPPLSDFKEPPEDQPGCEILKCPKCKEDSWVSEKKRAIIKFNDHRKLNIIILCYECILVYAQEGNIVKGDLLCSISI